MSGEKRSSADVFNEIVARLASVDSLATADAITIGALVREYGECAGSEATGRAMKPLLDSLEKSLKPPPSKPWETGP